MPFAITDEVFNHLWTEAELRGEAGCIDTEIEFIDRAHLPHVGYLHERFIPLQAGLDLRIAEIEVAEDLLCQDSQVPEDIGIAFTFCLSGQVCTTHQGMTRSIEREERTGYWFLENLSGIQETELWSAGQPFVRVYLQVYNPRQVFQEFDAQPLEQLPVELRRSIEGNAQPCYRTQEITESMYAVLRQILHCPYSGLLKRLYLQGKALELMTLQFEQLQQQQQRQAQLRQNEIDRIHHARDILIRNLDNPPSLLELARSAGMNDFALKQGFRQVFGTTVFQYLHEQRLEEARQLLITSNLKIQTVAQRVGFANRGYFAAAFRRKFGVNPNQYRSQDNCSRW